MEKLYDYISVSPETDSILPLKVLVSKTPHINILSPQISERRRTFSKPLSNCSPCTEIRTTNFKEYNAICTNIPKFIIPMKCQLKKIYKDFLGYIDVLGNFMINLSENFYDCEKSANSPKISKSKARALIKNIELSENITKRIFL